MLRPFSFYRTDFDLSLFGAGCLLLLAGIFLWWQYPAQLSSESSVSTACEGIGANYAPLSNQNFERLTQHQGLTIQQVESLLGEPVCYLPRISVRADTITERAVYRLEDGQDAVVAYEEGVLVGHSLENQLLPQEFVVHRDWQVQIGDTVGGYPIVASLGDLSVAMQGPLHAPEAGTLLRNVTWIVDHSTQSLPEGCALFISPQLPGYLSRVCGLRTTMSETVMSETVQAGQTVGYVQKMLHFSLLTLRQPSEQDAGWRYVAPSPNFLAQFLGA